MKTLNLSRSIPCFIVMFLLLGCGSQNNGITPSGEKNPGKSSPLQDGYELTLDQSTGKVELLQRESMRDVTHSFAVRLLKYKWDSSQHLLYATIELENLVDMCYWGVRLVFDNTGGRWIINSDGYAFYELGPGDPPARLMPFIAYKRDNYHRSFTSLEKDSREIIAYCPSNTNGVHFWIDAVNTWERDEPIIEEQFCHKGKAFSDYAVTAFCYDFQSHHIRSPRGINDLKVWADLTSIGGSSEAPMFDDGMHYDYAANDHIYGVSFVPNGDFGMIPIYCGDSDGNVSQNQVAFIRSYTLKDYETKTIEKGVWSELTGPHYEIIRDQSRWETFWALHKGAPEIPPVVDFAHEMVLVAIAGMAGGGQWIEINHVFQNTKRNLEIEVSKWNGSKGCILPTLLTNAYDIVSITINNQTPEPKLRSKLFYCDEQLPFTIVETGDFSKIHDSRELLVKDWNTWVQLWNEHTSGGSNPPAIDFTQNTVAAVFLGNRTLDDTYVKLDRVMIYQSPIREIYYTEHYPGYGCELAPLDCQPYVMIVFPKDDTVDYKFLKRMFPDDCVIP